MNERKNVVVIKDTKGKVVYVAYPKMLDKNEINKAINDSMAYQQAQEEEIAYLTNRLNELEIKSYKLELDIKLDRGEITQEEYEERLGK